MPPTSAERGHETRQRLLEAAAKSIVEDGWGAVTTRRVAERAGLRPGLVHYHFSSVDDLLIEAALEAMRREMERATETLGAQTDDPAEGVRAMLDAVSEYTATDPTTVLFSETLLAATRLERLRGRLAALLAEWRRDLAERLRAAAPPGSPLNPDDAEGTALVLGAAIDGLVLHRLIDPSLARIPVAGPLARLAGSPSGGSPSGRSGSPSGDS